ncbi:MFS transporter [Streptomyces oceani]|uniref:MFS transporter n=1 Tax=Streptomyces oceani TaxID=1075402 RepID=A0A1E7JZG7_9ACTN|nr:MFS transporter [Streptomyces oceani]OEU97005.1 MFS transporter [Streptomyces oceani]
MLPALCATQITSWGVLYYAFPVLRPGIVADTGWSSSLVTAAFSAALLLSAAVGVPLGRLLDRNGPRAVMTSGSVLAAVSLLVVAMAPNLLVFFAGWIAAGGAMAATFYQPAFAAVARWWGEDRVKALTAVTLAGGLASTVFAPVTEALTDTFGWRGSYALLALSLGVITVPVHALFLRAPWPPAVSGPATTTTDEAGSVGRIAKSRPFVLLAGAMLMAGFAGWGVLISLIPLMNERGADSSTAAWALALCGVGQIVGRILYGRLARHTGIAVRTVPVFGVGAGAIGAFALIPGPVWLLLVLATLVGMVRGNFTLLQATAVADRWGTHAYGRLSAVLAVPVTVTTAITPFAATALASILGGSPSLFLVLALCSAVAAVLALGTSTQRTEAPSSGQSRSASGDAPDSP